jgi:hypothetical protein
MIPSQIAIPPPHSDPLHGGEKKIKKKEKFLIKLRERG